jgi:hypothetical protein
VGRDVLGGEFAENVEALTEGGGVVGLFHLVQYRIDAIFVGIHLVKNYKEFCFETLNSAGFQLLISQYYQLSSKYVRVNKFNL